jgi:hypothetical protein
MLPANEPVEYKPTIATAAAVATRRITRALFIVRLPEKPVVV